MTDPTNTQPARCPSCGIAYGWHLAACQNNPQPAAPAGAPSDPLLAGLAIDLAVKHPPLGDVQAGVIVKFSRALLAALSAAPPAPQAGEPTPEIDARLSLWLTLGKELNPHTVNLVVRFARALAAKLADAERKYGYSDGWLSPDWMDECRQHLMKHIAKGDPRDVAAYCAFLWHHGESTAPSPSVGVEAADLLPLPQPCYPVGTGQTLVGYSAAQMREYARAALSSKESSPVVPVGVEDVAKLVYDQWQHMDGWVRWVDGGNSQMQDKARALARAAVERLSAVQGEPVYWECRGFDTEAGRWGDWGRVTGHKDYPLEVRLADLREQIAKGRKWELRALYAASQSGASTSKEGA